MLNKFSIPIMLLVMSFGLALTTACGANSPLNFFATATPTATATRPPTPIPPPTATPTPSARTAPKIRVVGNLVAANQASLSFAATGRVKELPVPEGTRVQAGTLLAALDTGTLELLLAQASAALELANANWSRTLQGAAADDIAIARANLERAKSAMDQAQSAYDRIGGSSNPKINTTAQALTLQQAIASYQGAIAQYNIVVKRPTQAERESGAATLAQAQAAFELAKQNVNNARLVAPFDGTVVSIVPKIGESAIANTPALIFADLTQMQVLINVDETTLGSIQIAQTATISVDAFPDKQLTGRVKKIGLVGTTATNIV
ncbi:MAG: efflux RND transporter periplasmic adaptor subunit, partial [Chloroflexota bacterium]